ncbi:Oxidoreductase [Curvularia kusanoi]|uniref:Mitochondrial intermembrane space import and assembly protein 40 n=1 Tax=Curvularia kusanoi TaxID=90978 RepID=A0A9P4W6E7_CURKU|nr:Oxidoreductase [Curvularia kusanoi]
MFRSAPRLIARQSGLRGVPRASLPARRFISTAPPAQKSRSWKSLVARLGVAGAIIYYYNTTDVFADEPRYAATALPVAETESEVLPTIESISAERAQRKAVQQQLELQRQKEATAAEEAARAQQQQQQQAGDAEPTEGGIEGLEAEADQQGAFNPETGEINWDCPCLGGMATGPCGEEFKAAFSCFVFSKEEPKGMDCIDKFKDMQNCFRQYPEIYGSEIDTDDDDDMTADAAADVATPASSASQENTLSGASPASSATDAAPVAKEPKRKSVAPATEGPHSPEKVAENRRELGLVPEHYRPEEKEVKRKEPVSESETLVPKAAHDGR